MALAFGENGPRAISGIALRTFLRKRKIETMIEREDGVLPGKSGLKAILKVTLRTFPQEHRVETQIKGVAPGIPRRTDAVATLRKEHSNERVRRRPTIDINASSGRWRTGRRTSWWEQRACAGDIERRPLRND